MRRTPPALPRDFLRTCLLLLLREQPAHGYNLVERLEALGIDCSDPGRFYRTLRRLEDEGHVRSAWEPSGAGPQRRTYEITPAGKVELHVRAKAVAAAQEHVRGFVSRYQEFVALSVRRQSAHSRASAR